MQDDISQMMTPFDLSVSSRTLQMLKILLPFLPPQNQRMMAIYIKFMELQNTITYFKGISNSSDDLFSELMKMMPASAMESYENIMNMMAMAEMFSQEQEENTEND